MAFRRAAGNMIVSGSTRYSSKGSRASHPRLKTFGTRVAAGGIGGMVGRTAGAAIGAGVGAAYGHTHGAGKKSPVPSAALAGGFAGNMVGSYVGNQVGKRIAAHQGWSHRTKQRMSFRVGHAAGVLPSHFHTAEPFHHAPHGQAALHQGSFQQSLAHHGAR